VHIKIKLFNIIQINSKLTVTEEFLGGDKKFFA